MLCSKGGWQNTPQRAECWCSSRHLWQCCQQGGEHVLQDDREGQLGGSCDERPDCCCAFDAAAAATAAAAVVVVSGGARYNC